MIEQTHPTVVKCRICGEPTEWKYEGCCPDCQARSSSADVVRATDRHSTREIVQDHTGQDGWSVCGPRALGWNPSWVKAADYDALKAENARMRAALESLRQTHDVCDDCWYTARWRSMKMAIQSAATRQKDSTEPPVHVGPHGPTPSSIRRSEQKK